MNNMDVSKVSIIIPAYNEEKSIGIILSQLKEYINKFNWEVIVIDDGSSDKTAEIAGSFGVKLLKHPYNKGNGAAVKWGIREALSEKIVVIDADGQHNLKDIPNLISFIGEYDLVIGSRGKDSISKLYRRLGNFILKKFASYLAGFKIPELTSGFRGFKKEKILEFIQLYPNGYSFPTTSTLAFLVSGYNVKFYPITSFARHEKTKSKLNPIKDGIRFLGLILRMITVFNPMKIFIPISVFLFFVGLVYAIIYLIKISHIPAGASLCMLSGLTIFFFGILADQISILRRSLK